jgi:hypothetical protein
VKRVSNKGLLTILTVNVPLSPNFIYIRTSNFKKISTMKDAYLRFSFLTKFSTVLLMTIKRQKKHIIIKYMDKIKYFG